MCVVNVCLQLSFLDIVDIQRRVNRAGLFSNESSGGRGGTDNDDDDERCGQQAYYVGIIKQR